MAGWARVRSSSESAVLSKIREKRESPYVRKMVIPYSSEMIITKKTNNYAIPNRKHW